MDQRLKCKTYNYKIFRKKKKKPRRKSSGPRARQRGLRLDTKNMTQKRKT